MTLPDTRASLILRLPDATDVEAWEEFVAIYQPVVYRVARRKGMQDADAQELVQEVLFAVSRAVESWDPDPKRGRFRDWLFRIAHNWIVNYLTRRKHQSIATGHNEWTQLLTSQVVQPDREESAIFELEFRRELFHRAAEVVRKAVKESTWQAFWLTGVEEIPPAVVAERLALTVGGVYIARSRVMARMRDEVERLQSTSD